jgi:hypothetical protein
MVDPVTEHVTFLDESSYIKNLIEAEDLVREYRRMSGDYDYDHDE